jgi:hypothetical protein
MLPDDLVEGGAAADGAIQACVNANSAWRIGN